MRSRHINLVLIGALCLVLPFATIAQENENSKQEAPESTEKPLERIAEHLRFSLNSDGSQFVQLVLWSQVWVRSIENSPGTLVNGSVQNYTNDIVLRRARAVAVVNLSSRYRFLFHVGANNQAYNSGGIANGTGPNGAGKRPQFYFHDAYNEFSVVPEKNTTTGENNEFTMNVGAGLHGWNGVSRMYNANGITTLTLDIVPPATIDMTDQFGRQLGIYAQGRWSDIGYRFSANKPFATNLIPTVGGPAVDNNSQGNMAYSSYIYYNFLDRERQDASPVPTNYLGAKKIFNLGAGFYTTRNATLTQSSEGIFENYPITLLGADAYLDIPIGTRGAAFTTYINYLNYQMGPNYLFYAGLMNPGGGIDPNYTGQREISFGNSQALAGTGDVWYVQAGYLLPKIMGKVRLQPFSSFNMRNYDALNQRGTTYQLGMNLLIDNHRSKITLQYDNRPMYDDVTRTIFRRGSEFIIGTQIFF